MSEAGTEDLRDMLREELMVHSQALATLERQAKREEVTLGELRFVMPLASVRAG